ncbi:MAG: hypothetical protein NTW49_00285 [Bacteroidia bacterium]|nr:hypothetical protein [Bacteroidia bacterium]
MTGEYYKKLVWITVFAVAMGFLESAVVVYLRQLYYPEGFGFPLKIISGRIAFTELLREIATIFMLIAAGALAGKNFTEKFAWFIYSFALWDIFYYVFLKLLLNWPESFLSWDILFLVPVIWVGPVLAPVINSMIMIALAMFLLYFCSRCGNARISGSAWVLLITGSLIILVSYTEDYMQFLLKHFSFPEIIFPSDKHSVIDLAKNYIPGSFHWPVFSTGVVLHIFAILLIIKINHEKKFYAG